MIPTLLILAAVAAVALVIFLGRRKAAPGVPNDGAGGARSTPNRTVND